MDLKTAKETFPDDKECLTYLFKFRFPDPMCRICGRKNSFHYSKSNKCFVCTCGHNSVYPRTGTLFEQTRVPLHKWFWFIALITDHYGNIRIMDIEKSLEISNPTASMMFHKLSNMVSHHLNLSKDDTDKIMGRIHPVHRGVLFVQQKQYIAEFVLRQRFHKKDPFTQLLALAMVNQNAEGRSPAVS